MNERLWSTALSAGVSSGPVLLTGITLSFPSAVLYNLDLSIGQSDLFGVSLEVNPVFYSMAEVFNIGIIYHKLFALRCSTMKCVYLFSVIKVPPKNNFIKCHKKKNSNFIYCLITGKYVPFVTWHL